MNDSKEKNGIVPIMERVTINEIVTRSSAANRAFRKCFGTWKVTRRKARVGTCDINLALNNIKVQIIKHYQNYRPWSIRNGRNDTQRLSGNRKRIWNIARSAWQGQRHFSKTCRNWPCKGCLHGESSGKNHVPTFIKANYKCSNLSMLELTPYFIKESAVLPPNYWKQKIPMKSNDTLMKSIS